MEMILGGKKDCAGRISGGEIFFITSKFLHLRLPHFLTWFLQEGKKHQNYYISFLAIRQKFFLKLNTYIITAPPVSVVLIRHLEEDQFYFKNRSLLFSFLEKFF